MEHAFPQARQVHFVDGHYDVSDPEQPCDESMPHRLRQDSLMRIEQDQRDVRVGSARRHVARILLVTGCIRDDELTSRGCEIAIGDVDGDALLALRTKAIRQKANSSPLRETRRGGL